MNTMVMGVVIIGIATLLTVVGALGARKLAAKTDYEEYQGMADPMLNVVATLFSILLGFLVAGAMDDFSNTRDVVEQEANRLADIYALSRGISQPDQLQLQNACRNYCDIMINEEWPAMESRHNSKRLWEASRRIWDCVLSFSPDDDRATDIHESLLTAVTELGENRRSRIVAMRGKYSPALWIVVFGGSIILIGCTYMFFIKNSRLQALMVALVALSLYLNVSLLWIYSNPFIGDLKITPAAFELDRQIFTHPDPPLKIDSKDSDDKDDAKTKDAPSKDKDDVKDKDASSKDKDGAKDKDLSSKTKTIQRPIKHQQKSKM